MKKGLFVLIALGLLSVFFCQDVLADSGLINNPANGHYYQRIDFGETWPVITWAESKAYCEDIGGHLATITSQDENNFIFNSVVLHNVTYFIGGFQPEGSSEPSGGWQWVTGEPWEYTNWDSGEPNNKYDNEHWLNFYANHNGEWNDIEDWFVGPFICEWDSVDVLIQCDPEAEWKNHGHYVRCVSHEVERLVSEGFITQEEGDGIVSSAAQSDVGK